MKIGSVLSIALSPAKVCGATVMSIVSSLSEIRVTVKWDDGDELFGNTIVLFGLQVRLPAAATLPAIPDPNPNSNCTAGRSLQTRGHSAGACRSPWQDQAVGSLSWP